MYSRNNQILHRNCRSYFDRPLSGRDKKRDEKSLSAAGRRFAKAADTCTTENGWMTRPSVNWRVRSSANRPVWEYYLFVISS